MNVDSIFLKIGIYLEDTSVYLRNKVKTSKLNRFLKENNLQDGLYIPKEDRRFNPYECANLILVDKLIKLNIITFSDIILDVGAGVGIFLFYLSSKGFNRLYGIELNPLLIAIFKNNIISYSEKNPSFSTPVIIEGNALLQIIPEDVNCFFFYNPFHDETTYINWLSHLKMSLKKNKRKIKLIFLYPSLACYDAISRFPWLKKKQKLIFKEEVCWKCIKFVIYENNLEYDY